MTSRSLQGLLLILGFCAGMRAQTTFSGHTVLQGTGVTINPGSTYTHVYVVFPPQNNPVSASNNDNFRKYVMTQNAVEGVTIPIQWNWVEGDTLPTTTPCSPVGTDVCQQDPLATTYYHTYNWSPVDGVAGSSGCTDQSTQSLSQWFCDFPNHDGTGVFKKVNIQLFGYGNGANITPGYVAGPAWASAIATATSSGYAYQDVLNVINDGACTSAAAYSGTTAPASVWKGDGNSPYSVITVTGWNNHPFVDGDNIWVSGFTNSAFNVSGQHGAAQYGGVVHYISSSSFSYTGSGSTLIQVNNPSSVTVVSGIQSWIVPYEQPYQAAYEAFLKAAIYHFNHLNIVTTSPANRIQTTSQIVYIRPGVARRGEATPICTTDLMSGGSVPSNPAYSQLIWQGWYTTVNATVQSASPLMQIMFSIDAGDPASRNALYATQEAGIAVSYSDAVGKYNGFGSQGLANSDMSFNLNTCDDSNTGAPNTNENWGCMFAKYWSGATGMVTAHMPAVPTTVPLELQQADCSNPTNYSLASTSCVLVTPYGLTGDLRTLYPFATSHYASILELYSQDALLAYDPYFCDPDNVNLKCIQLSGYDWFGTTLPAAAQYSFFEAVGSGPCTSNCYAATVNTAQGNH